MYLFNAVFGLFGLALVNPVGMYMNRHLHSWNNRGEVQSRLANYSIWVALVSVLAAVSLLALGLSGVNPTGGNIGWVALLVGAWILINTWHQTVIPSLNLLGHTRWFVWGTVATTAIGIIAAATLTSQVNRTAEWWLAGMLLSYAVVLIPGAVAFSRIIRPAQSPIRLTTRGIGRVSRFAIPLAVAVGLTWIHFEGYRFVFVSVGSLELLGLFMVGTGVSTAVFSIYETTVTQHLQPSFYQALAKEGAEAEAWTTYAGRLLPALFVTVAFVTAAAQILARFILAPQYSAATAFIVWGALVAALRLAYQTVALAFHGNRRTSHLIPSHAAGAGISLLATYLLVPILGGHGAGIALSAATLFGIGLLWLSVQRQLARYIGWTKAAKGAVASIPLLIVLVVAEAFDLFQGSLLTLAGLAGILLVLFLGAQYLLLIHPVMRNEVNQPW